jgi:hypothetical protein
MYALRSSNLHPNHSTSYYYALQIGLAEEIDFVMDEAASCQSCHQLVATYLNMTTVIMCTVRQSLFCCASLEKIAQGQPALRNKVFWALRMCAPPIPQVFPV